MLRFHAGYALATAGLFAVEALIALYVHDHFVRPYVGDSLVVVLIYLAFRAVTTMRVAPALGLTLVLAAAVEVGQRFNLVGLLGLGDNHAARVVVGTGFDPWDFMAYGAGGLGVLIAESARKRYAA